MFEVGGGDGRKYKLVEISRYEVYGLTRDLTFWDSKRD